MHRPPVSRLSQSRDSTKRSQPLSVATQVYEPIETSSCLSVVKIQKIVFLQETY